MKRPKPGEYATPALNERMASELVGLSRDIAVTIDHFLRHHKVSQKDLAGAMGVTEGRVSQILSGDSNLTVRSLAAIAAALDARFVLSLVPNDPQRVGQGATGVDDTSGAMGDESHDAGDA